MLKKETEHFKKTKAELLEHHKGKFAVIVGEELIGIYDTDQAAYEAGIAEKGNVPMLVKKIAENDEDRFDAPALALGLLNADPQL